MKKIYKIAISLIIEKVHRYVFDKLYIQSHVISRKERFVINIYNILVNINPKFRVVLVRYKPIIIRFEKMNSLPLLINLIIIKHISSVNIARYGVISH